MLQIQKFSGVEPQTAPLTAPSRGFKSHYRHFESLKCFLKLTDFQSFFLELQELFPNCSYECDLSGHYCVFLSCAE